MRLPPTPPPLKYTATAAAAVAAEEEVVVVLDTWAALAVRRAQADRHYKMGKAAVLVGARAGAAMEAEAAEVVAAPLAMAVMVGLEVSEAPQALREVAEAPQANPVR